MHFLNNKIKLLIILIFFIIIYLQLPNDFILNCGAKNENIDDIIILIKKYLDSNSFPILTKNEKIIAEYWKTDLLCPFSKLISHGLTKEEALLIIDFFQIENIEDLNKLEQFIKNIK